MKIVYIAHPVSGDVPGNIEKILSIVRHINLTEPDVIPFVPYLADIMALNDDIPEERARGIKNSTYLMGFVDELRLYGPCISPGMEQERLEAFASLIPVFDYTDNKIQQTTVEYSMTDRQELSHKILTEEFNLPSVPEIKGKWDGDYFPLLFCGKQYFICLLKDGKPMLVRGGTFDDLGPINDVGDLRGLIKRGQEWDHEYKIYKNRKKEIQDELTVLNYKILKLEQKFP